MLVRYTSLSRRSSMSEISSLRTLEINRNSFINILPDKLGSRVKLLFVHFLEVGNRCEENTNHFVIFWIVFLNRSLLYFSIEDLLTLSRTQDITCSGMTLFNSVFAKSRCSFTRCLLSFAIIFALKDFKNHPVLSKNYLEIESMGNFIGTVFKEKQ